MSQALPPSAASESSELFSRAAFGSIRGYVYQAWVAVLRWLELADGSRLRLEGHEDIDILGPEERTYEQVKHLSVPIGLGEHNVRKVLRGFLERHAAEDGQATKARFVLTTTAGPNQSTRGDGALLAWFEGGPFPGTHLLQLRQALQEPASEAFNLVDSRPDGWAAFAERVTIRVSEPSGEALHGLIASRLDELRRPDAPSGLLAERLLAEVLRRSSQRDIQARYLDRADLDALCRSTRSQLETWARDGERGELLSALELLKLSVADLPSQLAAQLDAHEEREAEAGVLAALFPGTERAGGSGFRETLPSELLRAAYERVPFEKGREERLAELLSWLDDSKPLAVRLIHAPGGQGKSRLALELIRRSGDWMAGFVGVGREKQELRFLARGKRPRLLVLDYSNEDPELVLKFLGAFLGVHECSKVRILLLGRHAGWLETLRPMGFERALVEGIRNDELEPLYPDEVARRQALVSIFASFTAMDPSEAAALFATASIEVQQEPLERALYLHMLALVAALRWQDCKSVEGLPRSRTDLLEEVLHKEVDDHWQRQLLSQKVPHVHIDTALTETRRIAAVATALGGLDRAQVDSIPWDQLSVGRFKDDALDALSRLYTGQAWAAGGRIPKLEPDLLGEHLVWTTLRPSQLVAVAAAVPPQARFPMLQALTRIAAHEGLGAGGESPRAWATEALREGKGAWLESGRTTGGLPSSSTIHEPSRS